jgi:hypothetical protein
MSPPSSGSKSRVKLETSMKSAGKLSVISHKAELFVITVLGTCNPTFSNVKTLPERDFR